MCTLNKICCCLELRLGALIVGIIDLILVGGGYRAMYYARTAGDIIYFIGLVAVIAHFIACILVIVSYFKEKKIFPMVYLITQIVRLIIIAIGLIMILVNGYTDWVGAEYYAWTAIIIGVSVYFWICIYSWFKALGGSVET
ncbi:uncharacterized protein LOC115623098 [Scaptodrosophila lebanonensis]|uniref:Uncharacterized protein LOC115623098 n=1 Tax=Drosophila lebanonensis TaxID=7225 RepID=A0A6J2TAV3_DROLE|nr:uncharacterized protein LOC115623098 [Scaptodrosophila lebanonensis]